MQVAEDRLIDIVVLGDGYRDPSSSGRRSGSGSGTSTRSRCTTGSRGACASGRCTRPRPNPPRRHAAPTTASRSPRRAAWIRTATGGRSRARNDAFREALWTSVDTFGDGNLRRYPDDLTIGDGLVIDQDEVLRGVYRNLVVSMLVRTTPPDEPATAPSGSTNRCRGPRPMRTSASGSGSASSRCTSSATCSAC